MDLPTVIDRKGTIRTMRCFHEGFLGVAMLISLGVATAQVQETASAKTPARAKQPTGAQEPARAEAAPASVEIAKPIELTRPVRPWEFLPAVGTRAGLLGNESGRMEAWVYPLKIFRDFHLKFHTEGRVLEAAALARTVTVRPESATILYAGDTFTVRETFFVPVREQGAVIVFDVE